VAASEVAICNAALVKLGADTIIALNENNTRARVMNLRYGPVRDAELHRRRWKFSIKRVSLPALLAAPQSDYDRKFQLPGDYLRLVEGGDIATAADLTDYRGSPGSALFSIEGQELLTNLGAPLNIRYIARITDTGLFNASFSEALSSRLAWECCEKITQSDSKRELAWRDYKEALREALRANAIETPPNSIADDSWLISRLG
jgi:hypothetical protein